MAEMTPADVPTVAKQNDPYAVLNQLYGPDPRPFMRAALKEIAPDVAERFKDEFDKAIAEWDGRHE